MGYRWNGTAWGTNNGQSVEYDWNTPVDELITAIGYGDPYKIDFVHDYTTILCLFICWIRISC